MAAARIVETADAQALIPLVRAEIERSVAPGDRISVPTGRTPEPLYRSVIGESAARSLWSRLRYLQLDEYIDPPRGTETFAATLARVLFDPLGVPPDARGSIDAPADPREAARLDRMIAGEPLGLVLLGLGANGHIAFNEPGDRRPGYHRVALTRETIDANFPAGTAGPIHALTIGIDQILAARRVLLWVPQPAKQPLLDRVLTGPEDPALPATALRGHADWVVFRVRP